jgi:hypothetical protein
MVKWLHYETDLILQFESIGRSENKFRFVIRGDSLDDIKANAEKLYVDLLKIIPAELKGSPGYKTVVKLGDEEGLELVEGKWVPTHKN